MMNEKLSLLFARLTASGPLGIAYSGGLDSRFLAFAASLAKARFTLLHVSGPHVSEKDTQQALAWAAHHGFALRVVPVNILALPEVRKNSRERCYYCKRALFSRLRENADGLTLCDGTNATDLRSPRPGLKALQELGIASPLADAGFEKHEIRESARLLGMERPEQPARPCLMTRFAYDMQPSETALRMVAALEEEVERALREFFPDAAETPDFRVRVHAARPAELHVSVPLSSERIQTLKAALEARIALEAQTVASGAVPETTAAMFKNMPVLVCRAVSGHHDRTP